MTSIPPNSGGFMQGLLNWIKTPEARGIGHGLLAGSAPRFGPPVDFGQILGEGFMKGQEYADLDRQRKLQEAQLAENIRHNKSTESVEANKQAAALRQITKLAELFKPVNADMAAQSMQNGNQQSAINGRGILSNSPENYIEKLIPRIAPTPPLETTEAAQPNSANKNRKITLANGMQVTPEQHFAIQSALAANHPEKIVDIIKPKDIAPSEFAKLVEERNALKQADPNSPDLPLYDQLIQRKAEGTPGMELTMDPSGAVTFSQGGAGKNKGPQVVKDAEGNDVVVTPQSPGAMDREQRRAVASEELKVLEPFKQPYKGEGSIKKLRKDKNEYKNTIDPDRKKELGEKLINATLADMLLPERAILSIIAAGKENVTETDIKHQRSALTKGWPETSHYEFNNLPEELYDEIVARYNQVQQQLKLSASRSYASGNPINTDILKKKSNNKPIDLSKLSDSDLDALIAQAQGNNNG